ncbi:hypothetical protein AMS62_27145 [Bacillus sp. FJAT-18019]|nr:hypothetical protein AMS62_27145 [Bacillus sp. FJAT-18019]
MFSIEGAVKSLEWVFLDFFRMEKKALLLRSVFFFNGFYSTRLKFTGKWANCIPILFYVFSRMVQYINLFSLDSRRV